LLLTTDSRRRRRLVRGSPRFRYASESRQTRRSILPGHQMRSTIIRAKGFRWARSHTGRWTFGPTSHASWQYGERTIRSFYREEPRPSDATFLVRPFTFSTPATSRSRLMQRKSPQRSAISLQREGVLPQSPDRAKCSNPHKLRFTRIATYVKVRIRPLNLFP